MIVLTAAMRDEVTAAFGVRPERVAVVPSMRVGSAEGSSPPSRGTNCRPRSRRNGGDGGKCYQGYTGYWPAGGAQKSLIGFDSAAITADLNGAVIEKVEAFLYFEHWHYGSGGTAGIGTHSNASTPTNWAGSTGILKSETNWPRGAGRWVTLPSSEHARFKSGAARGLSLQAPDTGLTYYGIAEGTSPGASESTKPKIRITYKK